MRSATHVLSNGRAYFKTNGYKNETQAFIFAQGTWKIAHKTTNRDLIDNRKYAYIPPRYRK